MKKRLLYILMILVACCAMQQASAQYYSWGSDPASLRWQERRSEGVRVICPDTAAAIGQRTLHYIEAVRPSIDYGFRHGPLKIPFVLHPENFQSNGLVMWMPKRIELLTTPETEGYSTPWIKHLVAHEYRHAVQYNNLNRGWVRVASWFLGQQAPTAGLLLLPLWVIEGDAVLAETQMSSYGRGLQPRFSIEFRAMQDEMLKKGNPDKWFCGSYRNMIPDQYQLGYQICSYAYTAYGENIWDKVVWFSVRNPYMIIPERIALTKYYDTRTSKLFRRTFTDLNAYWSSLPVVEDSAEPLVALPKGNYTTYRWPLALGDSTVLALKSDFTLSDRFVRLDPRTGEELRIARTGMLSTRPTVGEGRVWWTEYRRSLLFDQRVNSQLCYMDLADGRPRTAHGRRNALYPTLVRDTLAWIEYRPDGTYAVMKADGEQVQQLCTAPYGSEIHGLAWDDVTEALYVLVTDDSGMWPGRADTTGVHALREGAYITLSDLRAAGGKLYFGSIASGRDEAHCLDLREGREYRLTSSTYGSFAPMPIAEDEVLVTNYMRRGYRVARQAVSYDKPVALSQLPDNVVNPPRKKWDVINLDTVRFTASDSTAMQARHPARRYRKAPSIFNIHSWAPVAFDPFGLIEEHNLWLNLGATLISQNLLSNAEGFISYGWNRNEGSLVRGGLRYTGLGVHLELNGAYGGEQMVYPNLGVNYPQVSLDHYYSVGASALLPLYFQRGYHTRQLSFSAGWNYSNGLVAKLDELQFNENGLITNIENIGFSEGLHKLSFGAGFSDYVRRAHRDFAPPWGYTLSANYSLNPENRYFSDLVSVYGKLYTPGFFAHHSLTMAVAYQTSLNGFHTPDGRAMLTYKSTRLIPRGMSSVDIRSDNYTAASLNYELPIWYPEGGISSLIYFKRIRLNVGADFAQFHPVSGDKAWRRLWAYGGDLSFDVNIFRQSASATSSLKISIYKPSNGGVWVGFGAGLPF